MMKKTADKIDGGDRSDAGMIEYAAFAAREPHGSLFFSYQRPNAQKYFCVPSYGWSGNQFRNHPMWLLSSRDIKNYAMWIGCDSSLWYDTLYELTLLNGEI